MEETVQKIKEEIMADPQNAYFTKQGIEPLFSAPSTARLVIVGQAPGRIAQERKRFWDDPSGDRLRSWLGVDRDEFYNSNKIAILPMDFYFPGKGKGGDLPPRDDFASKWHPRLMKLMPNADLTILVGAYAVHYYLHLKKSTRLTDIVKDYQNYLPDFFPLVHPSPRNQRWLRNNPWFMEENVPDLQKMVRERMN
jgi:uracil-DNA glycosylase